MSKGWIKLWAHKTARGIRDIEHIEMILERDGTSRVCSVGIRVVNQVT